MLTTRLQELLTVTGATAATDESGGGLTVADSASSPYWGSGAGTIESTTAQDIEALTVTARRHGNVMWMTLEIMLL